MSMTDEVNYKADKNGSAWWESRDVPAIHPASIMIYDLTATPGRAQLYLKGSRVDAWLSSGHFQQFRFFFVELTILR